MKQKIITTKTHETTRKKGASFRVVSCVFVVFYSSFILSKQMQNTFRNIGLIKNPRVNHRAILRKFL